MEQFVNWLNTAWEWLNKPLPVVGLSVLALCWFAFLIFKNTSFGKRQLKKIREEFARVNQDYENQKAEYQTLKAEIKELLDDKQKEIDYLKELIKEICDKTPNKKIKAIGEKIYGGEKEIKH